DAFPRRQAASEEGTAFRRFASRLVPPGPRRRPQTHQSRSLPRRQESRCHSKEKETLRNYVQRQTTRRRPPQHQESLRRRKKEPHHRPSPKESPHRPRQERRRGRSTEAEALTHLLLID